MRGCTQLLPHPAVRSLNWSAKARYRELVRDMVSSNLEFYSQINGDSDIPTRYPADSSQPKLKSTGDR